jgi:hypothetical protein
MLDQSINVTWISFDVSCTNCTCHMVHLFKGLNPRILSSYHPIENVPPNFQVGQIDNCPPKLLKHCQCPLQGQQKD